MQDAPTLPRLADVLEALPGFVYIHDLVDRRTIFVSQRWAKEFGHPWEAGRVPSTEALAALIHPDDLLAVRVAYERLRDAPDDSPLGYEFRQRSRDGQWAWMQAVARPLTRDPDGRVRTIIAQTTDVTTQKEAQRALVEGEARFLVVLAHLPDAVFIAGPTGQLKYVNDAACAQLGYPRAELLEKRVSDFVAVEFQQRVRERLASSPGSATTYQSVHLRKDGTRVPVETVVVGVQLDGAPALMGVARDLSERERLEGQLRDAQRMESIGRLAGAVAHDFNNLLTAILGGASYLLGVAPLQAEHRDALEEIATAAQRGAELTRQLLTFGRRQQAKKEPLDLATAITGTQPVLRRLLDPRIHVETELAPGCVVDADRAMLNQVVLNLVLNARDAMPDGGTLRVVVSARSDSEVRLAVTDSGTGISPDVLPHIFEPFFTTKGDTRGTGIGLSTVYGVVTQHGGRVSVESEPGRGSRFYVDLPRSVAAPATKVETKATRPGRKLVVLLVDDLVAVRSAVARLLTEDGHRVLEAASPDEARTAWQAHRESIDVVLSDVALGHSEDGVALVENLRRDRADLPVALMSGYPRQAPTSGYEFLAKPFSGAELLAVLARLVPS